jgi:hypothetical protein
MLGTSAFSDRTKFSVTTSGARFAAWGTPPHYAFPWGKRVKGE